MTTPLVAQPEARKRRRKTRTRNVNSLPPIIASDLKTNHIDLTPGKESLVCPSCERWTPITGMLGTPKLVPHHAKRYRNTAAPRCQQGTNRRVTVDIDVDAWRTDLAEAAPTTRSRRATKVLPKPKGTTVPAPVHRIVAAREQQVVPVGARLLPLLERARRVVVAHRATCATCGGGGRCGTARELELRLREVEATAVISREQQALRDRRAAEQQRATQQNQTRAHRQSLRTVLPRVHRADAQRVHDTLEAQLKQLSPKLTPWERADLESAIALLERQLKQVKKQGTR
ncbi:hypothetical protein ABT096_29360 [Streptomyces sp. NPDC002561]|uniref:hypothetical protein n=1 Tax=Streptomyces sp. NPDC002561 TaxID=3154418 RepID=UPI00332B895D